MKLSRLQSRMIWKGVGDRVSTLFFIAQSLLTLETAEKSSKNALLWTFLLQYKWCLLSGILPRLAHTGLVYSQSFLIRRVLDYTADKDISNSVETAHGLVGAYAIVYIGIAVGGPVSAANTPTNHVIVNVCGISTQNV
jgi:hypothetical protein